MNISELEINRVYKYETQYNSEVSYRVFVIGRNDIDSINVLWWIFENNKNSEIISYFGNFKENAIFEKVYLDSLPVWLELIRSL